MIKLLSSIFVISFLLTGCGKSEETVANAKFKDGMPCNIKVLISGKAPQVQFILISKAKEKAVTIDRQIDVLDSLKDEFSFSSFTGGKLSCELKTLDSYGPEVTLKVFVNGKFWRGNTGKYNPKIVGVIPPVNQ